MIETVAQTGSTNEDLLARLASGETLSEGMWLRAERQSAGRGRSGRRWLSEPGNLYTSTVVSLQRDDPPAHTLSLVTGIAVFEVLQAGLVPKADLALKWPNDILVHSAKIAGILLERRKDTVVVGIGVNVLHSPELPDRKTTSIQVTNPSNQSGPERILEALAERFALELQRWRSDGLASVLQRWEARALPLGTALSVNAIEDGAVQGSFAGLDETGALVLRLANGAMRTIHAGDVSLIARG